jgi:hypothetical protein
MFTNQDSETVHFLILIMVGLIHSAYTVLHCIFQAIALFNADQHEEAMLLVKELVDACPNADTRACHVVEVSIILLRSVINTDLRALGISMCSARNKCLQWRASR